MSFRYKVEIYYDLGNPERSPNLECCYFSVKASSPKQALPRLRAQMRLGGKSSWASSTTLSSIEKIEGEELKDLLMIERTPYGSWI